jgi:hypothetical protein
MMGNRLMSDIDSKSREPKAHVGSIPTSGTNNSNKLEHIVLMVSESISGGI